MVLLHATGEDLESSRSADSLREFFSNDAYVLRIFFIVSNIGIDVMRIEFVLLFLYLIVIYYCFPILLSFIIIY